MRKILFFVNKIGPSNKELFKKLPLPSRKRLKLKFSDYTDLKAEIYQDKKTHFHVWHKGKELSDYGYVYVRNWVNIDSELAGVIAQYCKFKKIPFDDEYLLDIRFEGKLLSNVLFALNKMPIVHTLFYSTDLLPGAYKEIIKKLGSPFILKHSKMNRARNNYLIHNREEFQKVLKGIKPSDTYVCQKFISNDFEYRYLTFGNKVKVVMKRWKKEDTKSHKNNALGMQVEYIKDKSNWRYKDMAEKICKLLKREILGIDILIENTTRKPYILEANPAPGLDVVNKPGVVKIEEFYKYIKQQASK
jgi:glutathione synthase/RimK-type ligase-like ATP-grasp enzyme